MLLTKIAVLWSAHYTIRGSGLKHLSCRLDAKCSALEKMLLAEAAVLTQHDRKQRITCRGPEQQSLDEASASLPADAL